MTEPSPDEVRVLLMAAQGTIYGTPSDPVRAGVMASLAFRGLLTRRGYATSPDGLIPCYGIDSRGIAALAAAVDG